MSEAVTPCPVAPVPAPACASLARDESGRLQLMGLHPQAVWTCSRWALAIGWGAVSVRALLALSPAWSNPGPAQGKRDHCSSLDQ